MHLRPGEVVLRTVRRHLTPYFLQLGLIFLVAIPVYGLLALIASEIPSSLNFFIFGGLSVFIIAVIIIFSIDYLLDRIVITNSRVIGIDWRSIFRREEHEAELLDIQDIKTRELGILSRLPFFNFGYFAIETAASRTTIEFKDCPDPKELKHFFFTYMEKARKVHL